MLRGFTLLNAANGRAMLADPTDVWLEAHEFAHQWWGNGVTCRAWTDFWLNEGITVYLERRIVEIGQLEVDHAGRPHERQPVDAGEADRRHPRPHGWAA